VFVGNALLGQLRKMRMLADDDEVTSNTVNKAQSSQQPAWMRTLLERCHEWLTQLPAVSNRNLMADIWPNACTEICFATKAVWRYRPSLSPILARRKRRSEITGTS